MMAEAKPPHDQTGLPAIFPHALRQALALAIIAASQIVFWTALYFIECSVRPDNTAPPETVYFSTSQSDAAWPSDELAVVSRTPDPAYRVIDETRAPTGLFVHTFTADKDEELALLVAWTYRILEVRLNGQLLTSQNHKASWGLTSEFFPVMYTLPAELMKPDENTITFRVMGNRLKVLPAIYIGSPASVSAAQAWGQYITIDLPAVAIGLMIYVALLTAIIVWPKEDRVRGYALVGLLVAWTVKNFVHLGFDALLPAGLQEWFYFNITYGFLFAFIAYVLVATKASKHFFYAAGAVLLAAWLAMSAASVSGIRWLLRLGIDIEVALTLAVCLAAAILLVRAYLRSEFPRPLEFFVLYLCITALSVDVIDDDYNISHPFAPDLALEYYVSPVFGAVLAIGICFSLGAQSSRAHAMLASINALLQRRLAEKEKELHAAYEREKRIEHERTLIEERKRIMRDMHDGLGGQLMALVAGLQSDSKIDPRSVSDGLTDALDELRLIVDSLDTAGDDLGLALGAFRARIEPKLRPAHVELDWRIDPRAAERSLSADSILNIFRILQEACANTLRHSGANRFSVHLETVENRLQLVIADNGKGIGELSASGKGIENMRQRARRIGADITFEDAAPGLEIRLEF